MDLPKVFKSPLLWTLLGTLFAAVSSGAAAYQIYLTRMAADDAFAANLHVTRIEACANAIGYLSNSLTTQSLGVALISDSHDYSNESKAMLAAIYDEELGAEHRQKLRANITRLELLFPENQNLTDFIQNLGVFEFSFSTHMTLMALSYPVEEIYLDPATNNLEFQVENPDELYRNLVAGEVAANVILGFEEMRLMFDELSSGLNQIVGMCKNSNTQPDRDLS